MKIKTLAIAPYRGLLELMTSLAPELPDFDITVVQGDLTEVLPMLGHYEDAKFEMIISRGGTARLIREHSTLPVVEIQVSGYDILRLLTLLKGYQAPIEMIGFPNIIQNVVSIANLMNYEIPNTVIQHENEVDTALEGAKSKGAMVIVGDTITIRKAKEHGLQGVLITSGRESVMDAFNNARHIMGITHRYNQKIHAYEKWMDGLEQGIALSDSEGVIEYSNEAFHKFLRVSADESKALNNCSIFERFPYLTGLVKVLDDKESLQSTMIDPEYEISITCKSIQTGSGRDDFYLFQIVESDGEDQDLSLVYPGNFINSFPQLLVSDKWFQDAVEAAALRLFSSLPAAVYGEKGTEKVLFAGEIAKRMGNDTHLTEIVVHKSTDHAFSRLCEMILKARKTDLLYILGMELFDLKTQRKLVEVIRNTDTKILFSFSKDPKQLESESGLEAQVYQLFTPGIFYFPPLRDRIDKLEEYIRSFIITYNEKYGKQIVGVREEGMNVLFSHPWNGNLLELRNVIKGMMKSAEGEYIGGDVQQLLKQLGDSESKGEQKTININQPLEEIESEIIQMILKEENMNQSKTAKRLGIDRSTLWRKIKQLS
jgi:transcriptional regulator with PAS, ATPase and Fis domain